MRCSFALFAVWSSWGLWTSGITLRWLTSVYQWKWRTLLPLSAALELAAFAIFFRTLSPTVLKILAKANWNEWAFVVIVGSVSRGFIAAGFPASMLVSYQT